MSPYWLAPLTVTLGNVRKALFAAGVGHGQHIRDGIPFLDHGFWCRYHTKHSFNLLVLVSELMWLVHSHQKPAGLLLLLLLEASYRTSTGIIFYSEIPI